MQTNVANKKFTSANKNRLSSLQLTPPKPLNSDVELLTEFFNYFKLRFVLRVRIHNRTLHSGVYY